MARAWLIVAALAARAGAEEAKAPLTAPWEVIRMVPAPADLRPALSRDEALALASKYSGFPTDAAAQARFVLYWDTELDVPPRARWLPVRLAVRAWVVSLPNASFVRASNKERVNCPLHVAVDAETGQFLAAFGDSAKQWAQGSYPEKPQLHYGELLPAREPPKHTVRQMLAAGGYRPSPLGQFFLRYGIVRSGG